MLELWYCIIASLYLFAGILVFNLWKDRDIWKNK
jgi:hypothetical protein